MSGLPEHLMVNVITPAAPDKIGLISLEDCKVLLDIPTGDTSKDAQLQMLIDQNSIALANMANRETWAKEKVTETWECVGPVCCPDGSSRIWLTRAPVKKSDIESIESPVGTPVDPAAYTVEERTGQLKFPGGISGQLVITYTGGYVLPDEAPLDLQMLAGMAVRTYRTEAAAASTSGAGIRMLAHKESRIMYFSPKDMAGGGSTGSTGATPSQRATADILAKYTRMWI
jgi:hypothetical protein